MRFTALIFSAALLVPLSAMADEDSVPPVTDPLTKKECGACHMAYQPAFLPAASWREIMATLDDHFGEDASLDPETRGQIESYLAANAGRGRARRASPPLRITNLKWFTSEHRDHEVTWLWKNRNVKTMADCAACHRGAGRGYFEDD